MNLRLSGGMLKGFFCHDQFWSFLLSLVKKCPSEVEAQ
jgi:hypothetical protein